jgi:hypothetical protein
MWNDGSGFEHFLTDPWAAHPVVNPKTVCFKGGGGGGGNDASYYDNIRNQEAKNLAMREETLEHGERAIREQEAADARAAEDARQAKIRGYETDINTRFDTMFTPDFYTKRENDYRSLYKPQLDDQFQKSQKDLTYWLADRGTLNSSVRGEKTADLQKLYDSGTRKINDSALNLTNETKGQVANARSGLISDARNANAFDEPTVVQTMSSLAAPTSSYAAPVFSSGNSDNTFADMFGTFTNVLGKQAAMEKAAYLSNNAIKPTFNTGLFAPHSDAVRNLR